MFFILLFDKMKLILTEKEQFELINTCPACIKHIHNPTRAVIIATLKKDGSALKYIEKQDSELHQIATKFSPGCLEYCINPSKSTIMRALERDGKVIKYVKNPDDDMIRLSLLKAPWMVSEMKNPSYEYQMLIAKNNPGYIDDIKNPHDDILIIGLYLFKLSYKSKYDKILDPYIKIFFEKDEEHVYINPYDSDESDMEYERNIPPYNPEYHKYYAHAIKLLDDFHLKVPHLPGSLQILKTKNPNLSLLFEDSDLNLQYNFI